MKIFNQFNPQHEDSPEPKALVDAVHENLYQLNHFLKINNGKWYERTQTNKIPLFALIGPSQAGKTTLLRSAKVNFSQIIAQENPLCKTWLTDEAIYLNIKGRCISNTEFLPAWPRILKLLTKFHSHRPLDGILFVLNLRELISLNTLQLSAILNDYVACLSEFTDAAADPVPVHLIITHVDAINGFTDFFADLTDEQLEKSFGFSMNESENDDELLSQFSTKYQTLINNLEAKLIKRLHQTKTEQQKSVINNFPLQLESIKNLLNSIISQLFTPEAANCNYIFRGFFLCSNTQNEQAIDQLSKPLIQAFSLNLPVISQKHLHQKTYFTKKLLLKDCPSHSNQAMAQPAKKWITKSIYAAIAITVLSGSIIWSANNFQQDIHIINISANAMRQYQAIIDTADHKNFPDHLLHLVKALHILQKANNLISKQNQETLFISQTNHLQKRFNSIYRNELSSKLLPLLASDINNYLQSLKPNQADKKYSGLKAYLMLAYTQHMDINYFLQWFENNWQHRHDKAMSPKTVMQLRALLNEPLPPINLDMDTVTETRNYINSLPKSFLAYMTLKDSKTLPSSLHTKQKLSIEGRQIIIPVIFQKQFFKTVYEKEIRDISKAVSNGNWVLGKNSLTEKSLANNENLVDELRKLYIDDYKQWWLQILTNLNFHNNRGLSDTAHSLKLLSTNSSALQKILNLIKDNTSPSQSDDYISELFNEEIASHFIDINRFTIDKSQELRELLLELEKDLHKITTAFDSNQAAFNYAKYEFSHDETTINRGLKFADNAPPTLQTWLKNLINNSWGIIMTKTNKYIQHQWSQKVYPEYVRNIQGHYPFAQTNEMSIEQFNHFFAEKGTVNQFFEKMIKPFLAINEANWSTKQMHDKQVYLSEDGVQQFIRVHLIRKMFFTKSPDKMSFNFQLSPMQLSENLKEIIFNIDGQHYYNYPGSKRSNSFTWPYQQGKHRLSIDLADKSGKHTIISKQGDWALYKLFDQYPIQQLDKEAADYVFKLDLDGKSSEFKITTDSVINPLTPNIVKLLELPKQLIVQEYDVS